MIASFFDVRKEGSFLFISMILQVLKRNEQKRLLRSLIFSRIRTNRFMRGCLEN